MEFICYKKVNGVLYKVFQSKGINGTIYFEKVK